MKRNVNPKSKTWTLIEERGHDPKNWTIIGVIDGLSTFQVAQQFINLNFCSYESFGMFRDHNQDGFFVSVDSYWHVRDHNFFLFEGSWKKKNKFTIWIKSFFNGVFLSPYHYFEKIKE